MTYDGHSALIVVDVQNDFADPNGSLYVNRGEDVVGAVNEQVRAAAAAGATIAYTQDWHPPDTAHFEKDGGVWPVHCVRDTWGAELHPALDVHEPAARVRKGIGGEDGYSGFTVRDPTTGEESPTELENLLRGADIERVVVVGLATDYCVKETAIDAARLGFETTVLRHAIAAVDREAGDGDRALEDMAAAGAVIE